MRTHPRDSSFRKIAITTGDIDGIGLEISQKALKQLGPKENVQFFLWRSPNQNLNKTLLNGFSRQSIHENQLSDFLLLNTNDQMIEVVSEKAPPFWVEESAKLCTNKSLNGLVTGPLSKTLISDCGLTDIGHTDILKRVSGTDEVFMTFLGEHFCVLLVTGHIPLQKVSKELTFERLDLAITKAQNLSTHLEKPMALVGLNPHAGEEGLIGLEEKNLFEQVLNKYEVSKGSVVGPLVPDAAFLQQNWNKYSIYICPYHDQGLIPFKMAHNHSSGCHLSLGLPFVRTSVDHGTAKELFGTGKAHHGSFYDALQWALRLL